MSREAITVERTIHYEQEITAELANTLMQVASEVVQERVNQHEKWGEQNWPDFAYSTTPTTRCADYGIPDEDVAKSVVETHAQIGSLTYGDILMEEVAEAFSATNKVELRKELVQVAAVAQAWVEKIDRDLAKEESR